MTYATGNGSTHAAAAPDAGHDYTLCECDLQSLITFISELEHSLTIIMRRAPSICLTMIPAEDSLEQQPFYLGEALTTECEVEVGGVAGFGLCLGDEPVRAYCLAVADALLHNGRQVPQALEQFLHEHAQRVAARDQAEFDLILQTQVDFKLMEEA